jgi:hypothetical protein
LKKQDEIAKLIRGNRRDADNFINQIYDAISYRPSLNQIAYTLQKIPQEKRTIHTVVIALEGKSRSSEDIADKSPAHTEEHKEISSRSAVVPKIKLNEKKRKDDWLEFAKILQSNHISYIYHFTDSRNIPSIKQHGGLYSWYYCEMNGIEIPCPGGGDLSRQLDIYKGLQDYVRLSFNPNPPMLYVATHILTRVILVVDPSVIYWETTMFSDVNATDNLASVGDDLLSFQKISFDIATRNYWNDEMEKKWRQAEVLVKTHIPLSCITIPGFTHGY